MKKLAIYSVLFSTTLFAQTSPQIKPADPRPLPVVALAPSFDSAGYFFGGGPAPSSTTDVASAVTYLNKNADNSKIQNSPVIGQFITNVFSGTSSDLRSAFVSNLSIHSSSWLGSNANFLTSRMLPSEFALASGDALKMLAPATQPEKALQAAPLLGDEKAIYFLMGMIPATPDGNPLATLITAASYPQNPDEAKGAVSVFTTILKDFTLGYPTFNAYIPSVQAAIKSIPTNTFFTPDQKAALNKLLPASDSSGFVPTQKNSAIPKAGSAKTILPKS